MAGSLSPETASRRSRVIALSRHRGPDDPATIQAKRDLEASKLRDHIERVLTTAPPLTRQQRAALAELLRPVRRSPRRADALDPPPAGGVTA